ncbi:hypothetical protein IQ07DRAFT_198377 [Pyrenochaeta sp. DS3sAY3a]|nr:hypothetical protein IQ07DRAFT_198377 [Pyrenochaeta sp. DS3sAY3a]
MKLEQTLSLLSSLFFPPLCTLSAVTTAELIRPPTAFTSAFTCARRLALDFWYRSILLYSQVSGKSEFKLRVSGVLGEDSSDGQTWE